MSAIYTNYTLILHTYIYTFEPDCANRMRRYQTPRWKH